jgi:hypothetical protein
LFATGKSGQVEEKGKEKKRDKRGERRDSRPLWSTRKRWVENMDGAWTAVFTVPEYRDTGRRVENTSSKPWTI